MPDGWPHRSPSTSSCTARSARLAEVQHRSQRFRQGREQISLAGRVAVIVDDGIATGATAKAACQVARAQQLLSP